MTENKIELKPCPFCGGQAEIWHCNRFIDKMVAIRCMNCNAQTFASYDEAEAVKRWNTRSRRRDKDALFQPCPFCGSDSAGFDGCYDLYRVQCGNCHAGTGRYFPPDGAISEWNRRA